MCVFTFSPPIEEEEEQGEEEEEEGVGKDSPDSRVGGFMKRGLRKVGTKVGGVRRSLQLWKRKKKTGDLSKGQPTKQCLFTHTHTHTRMHTHTQIDLNQEPILFNGPEEAIFNY